MEGWKEGWKEGGKEGGREKEKVIMSAALQWCEFLEQHRALCPKYKSEHIQLCFPCSINNSVAKTPPSSYRNTKLLVHKKLLYCNYYYNTISVLYNTICI